MTETGDEEGVGRGEYEEEHIYAQSDTIITHNLLPPLEAGASVLETACRNLKPGTDLH